MVFDRRPYLLVGELLDTGQLSSLFQSFDNEGYLSGGGDVRKEGPAVSDDLCDGVANLGDGKNSESDWKPAVGCSEKDCPRFRTAVILEPIQVRVSASACWKVISASLPESLRHILGCVATITFDPQVFGLK